MSKNKLLRYGLIFLAFLCLACLGLLALSTLFPTQDPTPAAQPPADLSEIIAQTAAAARAQTQAAYSPTSASTATLPPTDTPTPTLTFTLTSIPTQTNTPITFATFTPFVLDLPPQQSAPCSCYTDLNCSDFSSQSQAQTCFNYCRSLGLDDPHGLDRNNNNLACEDTNY